MIHPVKTWNDHLQDPPSHVQPSETFNNFFSYSWSMIIKLLTISKSRWFLMGKYNFFTNDGPPYHEITLWSGLSFLNIDQKTLLNVNWYHELLYRSVAVLSDVYDSTIKLSKNAYLPEKFGRVNSRVTSSSLIFQLAVCWPLLATWCISRFTSQVPACCKCLVTVYLSGRIIPVSLWASYLFSREITQVRLGYNTPN